AIVIGAGHNGLVVANYLAKAKFKVLVVERRSTRKSANTATLNFVGLCVAGTERKPESAPVI
ncbi:hypothetical protein B9Q10_01355, partial [Candidatus Marsarchaeota G2 archaeon ECH_B_SAG-E12]